MLLRSNIEYAKRVFIDRLTTDAQPLAQSIDQGPGDEYEYGGVGDSGNFGVGFDCSGLCGVVLAIALYGPGYFAGVGYQRLFSTESFPGPLQGFRETSRDDLVNGDYPIKVMICHGGGGPYSHMACNIDGWDMESNGDFGLCTLPGEVTGVASDYWNAHWVFDGPIEEDTTYRTPMTYPRGVDYAGGKISGAVLKAAGIDFVCRYLTNGYPKQLAPDEFEDLVNNGIGVVFNYETDATFMLEDRGGTDATYCLNFIRGLPGVPADYMPTVYFSADWDASPDQQAAINNYLISAGTVLGSDHVGIYGGYWPVSRALDAGVCKYSWQSEAWSGGNLDARVNIVQRNNAGYQYLGGVQCDIDEAHTDDIGQYISPKGFLMALSDKEQEDLFNMVSIIFQQVAGIVPNLPLLPGSPTPFPAKWPQSLKQVLND